MRVTTVCVSCAGAVGDRAGNKHETNIDPNIFFPHGLALSRPLGRNGDAYCSNTVNNIQDFDVDFKLEILAFL
jgi:hypothetical protein